MRSRFLFALSLPIASLLLPSAGSAAQLTTSDGSKLIGTVVSASEGKIVFKTSFAGKISINAEDIESLVTDESVSVLMTDGKVVNDRRVAVTHNEIRLIGASGEQLSYGVARIKKINPEPWEIGQGYKWFGKASSSLLAERGNSEKNELDMKAVSTWRSLRDRYTLDGEWEIDEFSGEKTKDTWRLNGRYDYFLKNHDNYVGGLLRFEQDKFADLELRTTAGPYFGRQFYESSLLSLRGEMGASWVDERFYEAEKNNYPAALWGFRLTSDFFGGETTFSVQHDGIIDLTEPDALRLNTTIGIGMPIYGGIEAAVEIKYEYDCGAVEGISESDETYGFRIGYKW